MVDHATGLARSERRQFGARGGHLVLVAGDLPQHDACVALMLRTARTVEDVLDHVRRLHESFGREGVRREEIVQVGMVFERDVTLGRAGCVTRVRVRHESGVRVWEGDEGEKRVPPDWARVSVS